MSAEEGEPRCRHFGACGGCSLLDVPYAEERALKSEAFARMAKGSFALRDARLLPLLAAASPHYSRTSLKVPFGSRAGRQSGGPRERRVVAGFFRRRTHAIVDLEECAVQDPRLTRLLLEAKELAEKLAVPIYDEARHRGVLRHLVARVAAGTGETIAGLVVREAGHAKVLALARALHQRFAGEGLVGVVENVNEARTNAVLGPRTNLLCGKDRVLERQDGIEVETPLPAFVQVNAAQASVLYAEVARMLEPLAGRHVADLYSGFGPIALRLARRGANVVAIERNALAAAEGERAAARNGLAERVRFLAGDVEHALAKVDAGGLDAVVVDPPRRGLTERLVRTLAGASFPRMVYVSCNPDTFCRDLEALAPALRVSELRPVDLFPRTDHIESVALLERRQS